MLFCVCHHLHACMLLCTCHHTVCFYVYVITCMHECFGLYEYFILLERKFQPYNTEVHARILLFTLDPQSSLMPHLRVCSFTDLSQFPPTSQRSVDRTSSQGCRKPEVSPAGVTVVASTRDLELGWSTGGPGLSPAELRFTRAGEKPTTHTLSCRRHKSTRSCHIHGFAQISGPCEPGQGSPQGRVLLQAPPPLPALRATARPETCCIFNRRFCVCSVQYIDSDNWAFLLLPNCITHINSFQHH